MSCSRGGTVRPCSKVRLRRTFLELGHSRIPVLVRGVVHASVEKRMLKGLWKRECSKVCVKEDF